MKGISPLVGFTVVVLLSVSAIAIVIMFGLPLVEMGRESAVINEAQQNMRLLDNLIRESAAEGAGSVKKAHLSVSGGTYFVNPETDSLDYELVLQSDFLPKGTFTRDGKIRTSVTGVVSATDNTTHLILESEVLEVVFEKVGSETAFDSMNTSDVIKTITLKDGDAVIAPNDTSVIIGGIANTSWGTGYTKIAREGINLPRADVLAHVRSNTSGLEYEVIYTLYGSVDYLLVDVRNVSANRTTLNYAYGIGANSSDNIKVGSIGNITTFVAGGETEETTIAEDTVNLDNTNYTKNSSTFVFGSGNGVVSYNASDGTWRNVTELSDIGQGNWTYTHSSSNTTLNFTLAGSDGYEFGIRDSLAGGSYWTQPNGTLYGRINISNDFIRVGMTEHNFTIYNSSGKIIFNSSFITSVKVDNVNVSGLYGSGAQNKTVYFFDWANQSWKVWTRAAANSTHGMPDWLDPRNKQQFRWRYAFEKAGKPRMNITFMMTAHDPFLRILADAVPASSFQGADAKFEDDYTTNSGWTQVGSGVDVDSSVADKVSIDTNDGSDKRVWKSLGTALDDSQWVAEFEYRFTASTSAAHYIFVLSNTSGNPLCGSACDIIGVYHGHKGDHLRIVSRDGGTLLSSSDNIPVSASTTYYVRLERISSLFSVLSVFTDSARTSHVAGSPIMLQMPSGISSLQYLQHSVDSGGSTTRSLTATIDNTKIFDGVSTRSAHNVSMQVSLPENRTAVTTAEDGLIGYWNFNEGQGGNVSDVSGNGNTGRLNNGPAWITNTSCKFGNCLSFDGTNDEIKVPFRNSLAVSDELTITAWINIKSTTAQQAIVYRGAPSGGDGGGNPDNYLFEIQSDGTLRFFYEDSAEANFQATSTFTVPTGGWNFVAMSFDDAANTVDLYLNGAKESVSVGGTMSATGTHDLTVGDAGDFNFVVNGTLDEVRIYRRSLSSPEIRQLYLTGINQQKPGIYFTKNNATDNEEVLFATTSFKNINRTTPSNFQIFSNHTDFFGFNYTFNSTQNRNFLFALGTMGRMNTTVFDPQNNATQFSGETIESVANSTLTYYDFVNGTSAKGSSWNVTDHGGGIVGHNFTSTFRYDGGAAGIWRFDEGAGLNATDSSGNGNTGTVDATWTDNASCRIGGCLIFDGSSDEVIVAHSDSVGMTGAITMEAWVKPRSVSSGEFYVFAKNFNPAGDISYGLRRVADKFQLYLKKKDVTGTPINGKAGLVAERWYHVVGTWDGFTARLYVNGVLEVSRGFTGPLDINNRDLGIGDWTDLGGYNWNGIIDEARLYPYALTESDVRDHYQRGVTKYYDDFGTAAYGRTYRHFGVEDSNTTLQPITPKDAVLHLRFNDNSTVNVTDVSGFGNRGSTTASDWITNSSCRFGGCMNFDGSGSDFVNYGSASSIDNVWDGGGTYAVWLYPRSDGGGDTGRIFNKDNNGWDSYTGEESGGMLKLKFRKSFNGGANKGVWNTGLTVPTNQWTHFAVVYDSGSASNDPAMYLNGVGISVTEEAAPSGNRDSDAGFNLLMGKPTSGTGYLDGLVDEAVIVNRSLSADEVRELYLGGVNRTINGRWHRVASADDLSSVSFNLTDKNNTLGGQDYDMRVLLFNSTATTTTQNPGAPAANCFTLLNTTQAYACSFDDSEYSSTKASGIVFAGDLERFSSVCNDKVVEQSGSPYKFNLTATGQIRAVLPFATATCTDVGNKTDNILDLGVPGTNFGSYALRGLANLLMSLQYERIQVGGDFRAGSGAHDVCVKKTGSEGRTVTVNVTGC